MWTIDPRIPMTLWWALAIAAAAAIVWYAVRRDRSMSLWRRIGLTLLMGLGILGPLLIALNPTWVEPIPPVQGNPLVTVLIDGTLSMSTDDAGDAQRGTQTRWQRAVELSDEVRPDRSSVEVRTLAFGELVKPYPEDRTSSSDATMQTAAGESRDIVTMTQWPQGHRSDLAMVLRQATRTGSPLGHAVVLISDGAHNVGSVESVLQAASEANALATPIYTVTLGTSVGIKNMSIAARASRIIAFPGNPIVLRASVGQNGLAGQSTEVYLLQDDQVLQQQTLRLTSDATQDVRFEVSEVSDDPMVRYRMVASEVPGEVTTADNQTAIVVQQLREPIGVLVLEGKPYWDSKFLARNLASDPVVDLTMIVRLGANRYLERTFSRGAPARAPGLHDDSSTDEQSSQEKVSDWSIERKLASPLESGDLLERFRLVILGRDASEFLTDEAIANLRTWISQQGGCLLCARGAPANQVAAKLAEILPVRWSPSDETHYRAKVSQHGMDLSIFDPLLSEGVDPLATLPSLAVGAVPSTRSGLPQVLLESTDSSTGEGTPIVTYQPFGSGETIVVEGAGMWRWAFLPPQHADKDKIYPTLWQSMIQWVISQQDMMPGQLVAVRSDRATFLSGDRATASVILRDARDWTAAGGPQELTVLMQSSDMELPQRISLVPSGIENALFKADLGPLGVGFYTLKVVVGEQDEVLASTAFDVRDSWFESLEVDARPDLMRQIAKLSGGQVLSAEDVGQVVERFEKQLQSQQRHEEIRTTMWDRPSVLVMILMSWMFTWFVRRMNGLV